MDCTSVVACSSSRLTNSEVLLARSSAFKILDCSRITRLHCVHKVYRSTGAIWQVSYVHNLQQTMQGIFMSLQSKQM